jgi:hypothetical protein
VEKKVRVALVMFSFTKGNIGGGLSANLFYRDALKDAGYITDEDVFIGTYKAKVPKGLYDEKVKVVDRDKLPGILNENYDLVVFPVPGVPKDSINMKKFYDAIDINIVAMAHSEWEHKLYEIEYLTNHPKFRRWIVNSTDLLSIKDQECLNSKPVSVVCPVLPKISADGGIVRGEKESVIVAPSRWITGKRTLEFIRALDEIRALGVKEEIWSEPSMWTYGEDCRSAGRKLASGEPDYKGLYNHDDLPNIYEKATMVYNPTYRKSGNGRRIELVSSEGMKYGCIPFVADVLAPEFLVHKENAILLNTSSKEAFHKSLVEGVDYVLKNYQDMRENVYYTYGTYLKWEVLVKQVDEAIKATIESL